VASSETIHGAPDCTPDSITVLHQPSQSYSNNMAECEISHQQYTSNSRQKDPN